MILGSATSGSSLLDDLRTQCIFPIPVMLGLRIPTTIRMATNLTGVGSYAPAPADARVCIDLTNGKAAPSALTHR